MLKKITVVDPRRVAEWTDEHDWDDFAEVGQALKADLVVGVDIEEFRALPEPDALSGKGTRRRHTVYDAADEGKVVYQKTIPPVVYPPNRGVDTSMAEGRISPPLCRPPGRYRGAALLLA